MDRLSPVSTSSNEDANYQQVEHDLIDNIAGEFVQGAEGQRKKQKKSGDEEEPVKKPFVRKSSSKRQSYNLLKIQQAYKLYDEFKAANVKDLQKSVSAHLNVPQGTFAGWLKNREINEEKLKTATEKELKHLQGKGNCHHPFFPEEEAKLRDIILARRANNEPCGGEFIRATMMKLVSANNPKGKSFTASHNWLTRFSARMNVPNRKGPIPGTQKTIINRVDGTREFIDSTSTLPESLQFEYSSKRRRRSVSSDSDHSDTEGAVFEFDRP